MFDRLASPGDVFSFRFSSLVEDIKIDCILVFSTFPS